MKKLLCAVLVLALLCGCGAQSQPDTPVFSADELARAALDAAGRDPADLERLDETLGPENLPSYLRDFYGLDPDAVEDCVIYRAGGVEILEVAAFRFQEDAGDSVRSGLAAYIDARQGDFTGYAPQQAAIAAQARAAVQGRYAALLLCDSASAAEAAFSACLGGTWEPRQEEPETPTVSEEEPPETSLPETDIPPETPPDPTPPPPVSSEEPPVWPATYPGRYPYTPPETDHMVLYDTAPILAAWTGGDRTGLSEKDRAILEMAEAVLSETLTEDMDALAKEQAIYGWVTSHVVYDQDHYDLLAQMDPDSYTPYGPLRNGKGVCLGFASVFQLLLEMSGVECVVVIGAAYQSSEDHTWNLVKLDETWSAADPTWDAQAPPSLWQFFNVSSDLLARTNHQWDYRSVPEAAALP